MNLVKYIDWEGENLINKENEEYIETIQYNNIKIHKRNDGTYKIMFNNNTHDIVYSVLSYNFLKEDKNYTYLKVIDNENTKIIYEIPKNIDENKNKVNFVGYTLSGKIEFTSEYKKEEKKCYIISIKTPIKMLNSQDKKKILSFFLSSHIINKLFNLFKK